METRTGWHAKRESLLCGEILLYNISVPAWQAGGCAHQLPKRAVQFREKCVSCAGEREPAEQYPVGMGQGLPVDFPAASDEHFPARPFGSRQQRFSQRCPDFARGQTGGNSAGHNHCHSPGKRAGKALRSFSSHNHGLVHCDAPEIPHLVRRPPRHGIGAANHTVAGQRGYDSEAWAAQTATLARIAECGW